MKGLLMKAAYTITYVTSKQSSLDDDFILLRIEAHSQEDAMLIINNIERYFKGVTVTCEDIKEDKPTKKRGRREQRVKNV